MNDEEDFNLLMDALKKLKIEDEIVHNLFIVRANNSQSVAWWRH